MTGEPWMEYTQVLYGVAAHLAEQMDMAMPALLITAEWPGLCIVTVPNGITDAGAKMLIGHTIANLQQRGIIKKEGSDAN